jgi:hypothetical protein
MQKSLVVVSLVTREAAPWPWFLEEATKEWPQEN